MFDNNENNYAEMPYKKETKIIYDQYDLTNIHYSECVNNTSKINSRKLTLQLYVCNGQCCNDKYEQQFFKCKLENINISQFNYFNAGYCPYITLLLTLNEPRKNSINYDKFHNIIQLFQLRKKYGLYTDYVFNNRNKDISDDIYKILKTIPEFSLKNVFHMQYNLEDIYQLIKENKNIDLNKIFRRAANIHFEYSLLEYYLRDVKEYRDFITCAIFRDDIDTKYLEWRIEHLNQPMIIEIGNYYMFTNYTWYANTALQESFFHISSIFSKDNNTVYLSFKKDDIKDVINYLQSHQLFSHEYINLFTLEKLQDIIKAN